jgi:hypothetical protein
VATIPLSTLLFLYERAPTHGELELAVKKPLTASVFDIEQQQDEPSKELDTITRPA